MNYGKLGVFCFGGESEDVGNAGAGVEVTPRKSDIAVGVVSLASA